MYTASVGKVEARMGRTSLTSICILAVLGTASPLAAQQVDVIRGRVVGPDRQPVAGARVAVTSISGGVNRTTRTDRDGRYTVTFPGGDGDYWVTVAAVGFVPRRVEVKRVTDEDFLLADATLQRTVAQLDTVTVSGRGRVGRRDANTPDVSGTERPVDDANVDPSQQGDLAAMAGTLANVTPVPGADGDPNGFSVLGLPTDQNQTSFNGLLSGLTSLPRDAAVTSSLVTSPYDVSTGGFSGARQNVTTRPGTNYVVRTTSAYGTTPQLQWSDATARALGQQSTNGSLAGLLSGPLAYDKAFYTVAYQGGRTENPLRTLLDPDPAALQVTGIAPDSARRLAAVLSRLGVPLAAAGVGNRRLGDRGSFLGTVDLMPPSSSSGQAFNVTLTGSWNRLTPASALLTEFPAHAGDRTTWNAGAQARHSGYVRNLFLSETTVGGFASRNYSTPYFELPSGSVLVSSTFAGGTTAGTPATGVPGSAVGGVLPIAFGGSASMPTSQRSSSVGARNQLSWFSLNNKHRLKLTTELRYDAFAQDMTANRFGTFSYNSLADLEAGAPARFTRQFAPRLLAGGETVAALSLGDSYKRTSNLQLQYGVRLDANHFSSAPAENLEVARTFGVPNTRAPGRVYVSPRAGFSWAYGTAPQVAGFAGAARGPRAVVRGGVGVFQNVPQATLLSTAAASTGLPAAVQQLTCVGSATPAPDWSAYAAGPAAAPDRCADASAASGFANRAPDVTLFARDWRAPRSIRSNLQWNGPVLGNRFAATFEGTLSLNERQPSFVDRNFGGTPQFALADEGGRPVYVDASAAVPATGAVAWQGARVSPLFARVAEQRSDLRSETRQLQARIAPTAFNPTFNWSLAYTYTDVREQARGFASAGGDPRAVTWGRGTFDTRHSVQYVVSYNFFNTLTARWSGNVRSGLPFTPQVNADVNGDGFTNDRAFVFDPARTPDPAVASGMRALLDAPGAGTACLARQLGVVAGRNSCTGPWSHTAVLTFTFNPLKVRLPQRANLSVALSNPLGAVDRLLHGNAGLRGWGQPAFADPTLLYVRGFDPQGPNGPRFRYAVNPRFGATSPRLNAFRQPAVLTVMLALDLGPTRERQTLVQGLDRGRRRAGERLSGFVLKGLYGTGGVPNPMMQLLAQADTLGLTSWQADSIATINRWYTVRLDSIWSPVVKEFAALPADYSHDAAYGRYREARRTSVDLLLRIAPMVNGVLTAEQRRKLPPAVASALDPRYLAAVRSGTAGVTGPGGFLGAAGLGAVGAGTTMITR